MDRSARTQLVKRLAHEQGFSFVGIARAEQMNEEARRLEAWLAGDYHGQMSYMANHFDKRVDPTKLVPGAKSVVSLLYNYHNPDRQEDPAAPRISQYAYGEDYHFVVKLRLKELVHRLQEQTGAIEGRVFVDSAPVLERDWARRAGNGWMGKHTLLIHPKAGSYFFLAELISDLDLEPDGPIKDYCGTCRRCIDACPTDAIAPEGYILDSSRCISYLTIELKEAIPEEFTDKMESWMFGCDICQEVCPWNRFAQPHQEADFAPAVDLLEMRRSDWQELTQEVFNRLFKRSAVKRTKFSGLQRNIRFLSSTEDSVG
ncbi:MAG: tRNA epoxyqueuosine(34) reductase QueG [Lewinella sp.]|nr:tRNA epoxyqueuosine(34) reductase QueG [Lewinella sp.]